MISPPMNLGERGQSKGMIRNVMLAIVTLALFGWVANMFLGFTSSSNTFVENDPITADGEIDVGSYASVISATGSFDWVNDKADDENISLSFNGTWILENYTLDNSVGSGTVENDLTPYVVEGVNTYDFVLETGDTGWQTDNAQITIKTDTDALDVKSTLEKWGPNMFLMAVAGIIAMIAAYVFNVFNRV